MVPAGGPCFRLLLDSRAVLARTGATALPLVPAWLGQHRHVPPLDGGDRVETTTDASGRLAVDGVALARLAQDLATADPDKGKVVVRHSMRNRFTGLVTRVGRDIVMAQVEIQTGPHRFVSLLSREAADELGPEPGMLAVAAVKATSVSVEIPASESRS